MSKLKTYGILAGSALATLAVGGSVAFAQYDQTTFGSQIDQFTSSTQGFITTLIGHAWVFLVALVVISGVIGFIMGHAKGWFRGGKK